MELYSKITVDKINRKNRSAITMRCDHVNRGPLTHAANVNPALSHLNRTLVGPENCDWYQSFEYRYKSMEYYKKHKLRKDAVIILEIVTSMSHDAMEVVDLVAWCKAEVEWMKKKYGKDNIFHAVLHMDEAVYHIHFAVFPIRHGRFCAKEINGGPFEFVKLQDEHAAAMKPLGLRRGLHNSNSRPSYLEIPALYKRTLIKVQDLPEPTPHETAAAYRSRVNAEYRSQQFTNNSLFEENERLKEFREYAHKLEEQVKSLREHTLMLRRRKIGKLFVENILAAFEYYHNQNKVNEVVEEVEEILTDWHEVGKEYMDDPILDEDELDNTNYLHM